MAFHLIPVSQALEVEGTSESEAVGGFKGTVVAIGLRDSDPIAAIGAEAAHEPAGGSPEGLLGFGTTHFLVADPRKPAPVWVAKGEVQRHRLA